jgi:hypothetical protein
MELVQECILALAIWGHWWLVLVTYIWKKSVTYFTFVLFFKLLKI